MNETHSATIGTVGTTQREFDAMIAHARRWLPYGGGPDEDILVTFGVPAWTFYGRLAHILDNDELTATPALAADESALREICRTRPRLPGTRTTRAAAMSRVRVRVTMPFARRTGPRRCNPVEST